MAFAYKPPQSKTWRIAFIDPATGKRTSISARTQNKKEAEKRAKAKTDELKLGLQDSRFISAPDHMYKLNDALKLFISQNGHKAKTIKAYKIAIDHLITAAGDKHIYLYNQYDYFALINHLNSVTTKSKRPLAKNSKANYTRHLNSFFNWLKDHKLVKDNVFKITDTEKKEVKIIPDEDLKEIFDEIKIVNKKRYDLIKLQYLGAYRAEEVLQARAEDFDFVNCTVRVNNFKGGRFDQISMIDDLKEHLLSMKLPKSGRLTFLSYDGLHSFWERILKRLVRKEIDKIILEKYGSREECAKILNLSDEELAYKLKTIPHSFIEDLKSIDIHVQVKHYTLHQLRKTRGSELANLGVDAQLLQQFMRHENFATTQQYYIKINLQKSTERINLKLKKKTEI